MKFFFSKRFFIDLVLVLIVVPVAFYFRGDIASVFQKAQNTFYPCQKPIEYTIGQFDTKFGISKSDFEDTIQQAENIWEEPLGKNLFQYVPAEDDTTGATSHGFWSDLWSNIQKFKHNPASSGYLDINLVYDYRQKATAKLQTINSSLEVDRGGYNAENARYLSIAGQYRNEKAAYDSYVADYNSERKAYDQKVAEANARGGARQAEYAELEAERNTLNQKLAVIRSKEASLNQTVNEYNTAVANLNDLAKKLNINVATYNNVTAETGREFKEGEFVIDSQSQRINIYQFDDTDKLVRVLAHELGHALGLEHVDNPDAIMYRLNEGVNDKLTDDDLSAVKTLCHL